MSAATNFTESLALTFMLSTGSIATRPTQWWIGLFTAAPSDTGGGTEVSGNAYTRQQIPSPGFTITQTSGTTTASNATTLTWLAANPSGWGTITHLAVFDASSGGNMLFYGQLTTSKTIDAGDIFQITAGLLTIELQ